jgi:polar amino acid transport system ATP-binding protein
VTSFRKRVRPGGPATARAGAVTTPGTPVLRVDGLRKTFGDAVVLDGLSLRADEHTCTALIGASGSGKSTLLRCIDLLEVVDDGVVELDGEDITDPRVDANDVRARIGLVFQSFNLFPHLTVLANVTLALRRVHRAAREQAEHDGLAMLERVGLRDRAAAHPDELSGGQQQRVAIARALVGRPRLMLFDEITSALDPELVGEVLALVRELREDGMTMLLATHEMGFARDVADQVCFLDGGRVLEHGPPAQVLGDPVEPRTRQFLRRIIEAGRL